jgi:hypothetical protein
MASVRSVTKMALEAAGDAPAICCSASVEMGAAAAAASWAAFRRSICGPMTKTWYRIRIAAVHTAKITMLRVFSFFIRISGPGLRKMGTSCRWKLGPAGRVRGRRRGSRAL